MAVGKEIANGSFSNYTNGEGVLSLTLTHDDQSVTEWRLDTKSSGTYGNGMRYEDKVIAGSSAGIGKLVVVHLQFSEAKATIKQAK